jgi:hypothetical protein
MRSTRLPARHALRRAALVAALFVVSTTGLAGMSSASTPPDAPAETVARVLPADRAMVLLEGTDPENAAISFVIAAHQAATAHAQGNEIRINMCVPCDGLA